MMINSYLNETITIHRWTGKDQWGEPNAPTIENLPAYVEWDNKLVRDIRGEQVVSAAMIYLKYDGTLTTNDKIQIGSVLHSIIKIERKKHYGVTHLEIYIA